MPGKSGLQDEKIVVDIKEIYETDTSVHYSNHFVPFTFLRFYHTDI